MPVGRFASRWLAGWPGGAALLLFASSACEQRPDRASTSATPGPLPAAPAPGAHHLSIDVRTGDDEGDGANAHAVEVCVSDDLCLPVDFDNADVLRPGRTDVVHLDALPFDPSQIDRVVLRSKGSADGWRPACVDIAIDGEIIHCEDAIDVVLGGPDGADGAGPTLSWTDPAGIHVACGSCAAEALTHGPLVGAVQPDSARLWVRTDVARDVVAFVHDEDDAAAAVVMVSGRTAAFDDFALILDASGLAPSHHYRAFFEVDGVLASVEASFHTPPNAGAKTKLRLGFGSCARIPPQSIFDVVLQQKPDLFVFGGDNTYADSPKHEAHWAHLRAGLEHPARAAMVAATPSLAIWDDHDFVGNDSNGTWKGKGEALRAFGDYFANTSLGTDEAPGVFSTFSWGDVELFLLDVRMYRAPDEDRDGSMLGDLQTKWLKDYLLASRATFKLLVSGSVWGPSAGETWMDHPGAREDLIGFLTEHRIPGVVLLGGDLHRSMLRKLPRQTSYALPEIVSSPLAVPRRWQCPPPDPEVDEIACYSEGNAVAMLTFDTTLADPQLEVRIVDEAGKVIVTWEIARSSLE